MKVEFLKTHTKSLRYQRNVLLAFGAIVLASLFLSLGMLFFKSERVVVVPAVVDKEFWVESNVVSSSYLEQFGLFISKLILEKSPQSARVQNEVVLRHTAPSFVGVLKKKLMTEEQMLQSQRASYIFFPGEIQVSPKNNKVLVAGERVTYVSQEPVSKEQERYILEFSLSNGRLLLTSLEKVND